MPEFNAVYRCINGCAGSFGLGDLIYRCPQCHDLLEVSHNLQALAAIPAKEWQQKFSAPGAQINRSTASSVWSKKEWVHPALRHENIVTFGEGNTPLSPLPHFAARIGLEQLWLKQCGLSHTGSFKDLGMTVLVSNVKQMIQDGKQIRAVVCASTGDTSASLAAYCAAAKIPAVVLLPADKISSAQLIQPLSHGALTLALETDFDGCMQIVKQLALQPDVYLANSMNALRLEGQKTVALEIAQHMDWQVPEWVILPGGNLGNVSAIGKGFGMMHTLGVIDHLPRLVCAQAERANPLYESFTKGFRAFHAQAAQPTLASAIQIGNPVSVKKAIKILKEFEGVVEQASEEELANAAALADRDGFFSCPQTGVALAVLIKLVERGVIQKKDRVVVISTASGLKFVEFKIGYHQQTLKAVKTRFANRVKTLPPDFERVQAAIVEMN
ncbi:MAG: threonine synthase [bacterium]